MRLPWSWHLVTLKLLASDPSGAAYPVNGLNATITPNAARRTNISIKDINCSNAVLKNAGDSCSIYFKLSYDISTGNADIFMPFNIYPQNSLNLPAKLSMVGTISPSKEIVNMRWINSVEAAYYKAIGLDSTLYKILKVENGSLPSVNINSIVTPSDPVAQVVHRASAASNDPVYGNSSECSSQASTTYNQVNILSGTNASCIVVYKLNSTSNESNDTQMSLVNIITDADKGNTFPYGGNPFTISTSYSANSTIAWQNITVGNLPTGTTWYSMIYANGRYVISSVDSDGNWNKSFPVATSLDGISWTQQLLPDYDQGQQLVYGNGVFVMLVAGGIKRDSIGENNILLTSTDGLNWIERQLPQTKYWYSVAFGNGKFVAISDIGNIAAVSTDGVTWTQSTLPVSSYWRRIAYGNGKFVAIDGNGRNNIAISADGYNWTKSVSPLINQDGANLTFGNGVFVLMLGTLSYTSTDGVSWSKQPTLPLAVPNLSVNFGNNEFFYLSGMSFLTSTDAIHWNTAPINNTSPGSISWMTTTFGNNTFYALPYASANGILGKVVYNLSSSKISNLNVINPVAPALYLSKNILIADIEDQNYKKNDTLQSIKVGKSGLKGFTIYNLIENPIVLSHVYYTLSSQFYVSNELSINQGNSTCNIQLNSNTRVLSGTLLANNSCDLVLQYSPFVGNEAGNITIHSKNSKGVSTVLLVIPYSSRL